MSSCEKPEIRARLSQALAHHKAGDLDRAASHYRSVLQDEPGQPEALHFLGVIAYQQGRPAEAVTMIGQALERRPERADFHCNLGNALKDSGRSEDAIAAYRRCLDLQPAHSHAWSNLGVVLHKLGQLDQAIAAHREALRINPQNPHALNNLGAALQDAGDYRGAASAFNEALQLRPDYGEALGNLGAALMRCGDPTAAERALRQALTLAPDAADTACNLGNLLLEKHDYPGALDAYRTAARLAPGDPEIATSLAVALSTQGRFCEARARLTQALELAPEHPRSLCALGRLNWAEGAGAAAVDCFRRALAVEPACFDAQYNLAIALYDDRDLAPSAAAFEAALALDANHAATHFYLGTIRDCQGEAPAAAAHFDVVARDDKGLHFLLDSWDYVCSAQGKADRLFSCSRKTLDFGLSHAALSGLVLEFGVLHGSSINHLAGGCGQTVHGFDSFEGLPEDWGPNKAGAYSTGGRRPEVAANVELHAGWFEDSLPGFVRNHPGAVRFMNVDCDLYSSTQTVFAHLADRIRPGSVIVFDEYLCTARWRADEYRAFQEAVAANAWRYRYLAHNIFSKQSVVLLTD